MTEKMQKFKEVEDRRRNWGGLSVMKTWGLSSLPKDNIAAACVSVQGGDMPEYILRSNEESTILFASDTGHDTFPWQDPLLSKDERATQIAIVTKIAAYGSFAYGSGSAFSQRIEQAANAAKELLKIDSNPRQVDKLDEKCLICEKEILFDDLIGAACSSGHKLGRLHASGFKIFDCLSILKQPTDIGFFIC